MRILKYRLVANIGPLKTALTISALALIPRGGDDTNEARFSPELPPATTASVC